MDVYTAVPCTMPPLHPAPSARILEVAAWLDRHDRGGRSLGIVNRRRIRGSSSWSLHACGRAIDWRPRDGGAGDWLMSALVVDRPFGVQRVIWRHVAATVQAGVWRFEPYGPDDHGDHLHVEVVPD